MIKQQFANWEDKKVHIEVPKVVRFGIVSDTHLGSKYQQLSYLRWFYGYLKKCGAKFVLHAGDIVDGEKVYRGHDYEIFCHGFDDQATYVVENYPDTLPTYFTTGNHDLSFWEKTGSDIGKTIASQRSDMTYLGQLGAYVYIGKVKVYVVHGMGHPSYALSYKSQKLIEGFSTENKPNMLVIGHFHTAFQAFIRNVYALHGGSFQGQTPFLRRLGLFPVIGGYMVEIEHDKQGITRYKFEMFPLYKPKSKDY